MVSVRLESVEKSFGNTQVLQGVELDIPAGAFAVLVGPSGCGKSTLLRLVAGLEQVSAGRIFFGEREVTHLEPRDRDLAMVFQSYALYPHMTVRENLGFGLRLRKASAATITRRIEEVARILELEPLLDRHPRALSGGQRQRVAMGRAIVRDTSLFLFDEPLSNLDPALRNQVRVDIRKLHDRLGATSIYVTHDQVEAMTLADVLFVVNRGIIEQTGAPLEIYRHPANRFVAGFVGSPKMNFLDGAIRRDGVALHFVPAGGGREIRVPDPLAFGDLQTGQAVVLGVRPQDVAFTSDHTAADLEFEVSLVETLGPVSYLHGEIGHQPFIAALEGYPRVARGEPIRLKVGDVHLFDAVGGKSLR